jgi:integrase
LILRNVNEATERPSGAKHRMTPLSLTQVGQLLTAIAEHGLYPTILLGFGTGLRRGELLALRWQDVDVEVGLVHVRQTLARVRTHGAPDRGKRTRLIFQEPKTEESRRTIPVPTDIMDVLKRHKARQAQEKLLMGEAYTDHGLVFCWADGRPLDPEDFRKRFVRLCKAAGLPPIRFHDARHTFATLMLELGESPKTVQTMLDHATITITLDIYSHVSLDLEKRAAAKLNRLFREAVTAP